MNFGWVDVDEGAGRTTNTRLIPSILLKFSLFMVLEDILSIVLRSCPGTALAQNELWMVDLGFLLFYTFLISFSFHSFLFKNLQD